MNRVPHRPLPLDGLRCFEAVARRLSFSAAAEEQHLTQPAVSRQIKSLEEELGAPLFHRATRRVELTAAGQALQRVVAPALARLDACVRQIRMSRSRALVSLTTFPSFASLWLMPRLAEFERGHPEVDLRISASDRIVEADDIELDLALRYCPPERVPAGSSRLFGEVLTPVIGTRLADAIARGEAPALRQPADLAGHTLLEMDDGTAHAVELGWPAWLASRQQAGLAPRRWITLNYTNQQIQAALAGQGVALARLALVHDMVHSGDLIEPFGPAGRRETSRAFWLTPLAGAGHPLRAEVRAFRDWVLAQATLTRQAIDDGPDSDSAAHAD
jgi:LysR family glycine cleavage system transcriptional activator